MNKKNIVLASIAMLVGATVMAAANQVINLTNGQSVTVQGVTITCESNTTPSDAIIASSYVNFRGDPYQLSRGAGGNGIIRNLRTGWVRDLGPAIIDTPVGLVLNNELYVFARGTDNTLWYGTTTLGWQPLGGGLLELPKIVLFKNDAYIIARGTDKAIWYRALHQDWIGLGGGTLSIDAIVPTENDILIQVTGTDNNLWQRSLYTDWVRSNKK